MRVHWLVVCALMLSALSVGQAPAAVPPVINIDWNVGAADTTHSGADGVLSSSGTVWNGLNSAAAGDQGALVTEFGVVTPVHVIHTNPSGGLPAGGSNNLQNAGYSG